MITLAFYKGRGNTRWQRIQERAIRFATRGIYSHVELIAGEARHNHGYWCYSSSGRDRGVRKKWIRLKPKSWDLVALSIQPESPIAFIQDRIGLKYDYLGLLLSHVLALGAHDKSRWFCSEICAAALGMKDPQRVSPQFLFDVVTWKSNVATADPDTKHSI